MMEASESRSSRGVSLSEATRNVSNDGILVLPVDGLVERGETRPLVAGMVSYRTSPTLGYGRLTATVTLYGSG
jgi:hypothetical protein